MRTHASAASFYGREAELAVLGEALDRVASGRSAFVYVDGEAGIGKSRLLAATVNLARGRGLNLAVGRAVELEQTRPFGVVAAALGCVSVSTDQRRADIAGLLAPRGDEHRGLVTVTNDPGLQFRVVDALVDLVEELALAGPLVICLDDLQWADPSSVLTLGVLIRRVAYLPVALIGCLRPSPRGPELTRLVGALEAADARLLMVGPLGDEAVRDLVAEAVAAEPGGELLAEIAGAAGNPLYITELLGAFLKDGTVRTANGHAEVTAPCLPPTLRLTILRRLSFLSESTLAALCSASILGSSFTVTDLSVTTAQPALDLSMSLTEAVAARVLEADAARLRFRHDLIRDAIYEDLPLAVRCGLHREAGQRLALAEAPVQQVAEHLSRGATQGDREAIDWLTRAARESAARSPTIAADLLERAIALMESGDQRRDQWILERARALVSAGRVSDAAAICEELLCRSNDPHAEGPARLCLGHALLVSGRARDGLRELEQAARTARLTDVERASALGWASVCRIWLADLDGASVAAGRARIAADAVGDHMITAIAVTMSSVAARLRGQLGNSIRLSDEAVLLADRSPGRQGHRYPVHAPRVYALIELDRLDEARSTIDTGMRISEELGTPWHLASYQMVRAMDLYIVGEWDDALAEIEASIESAQETGEAYGLIVGRSLEAMIRLHRNELTRAREAADAAVHQTAATATRYNTQWAQKAHALVIDASGDVAGAYAELAAVWDECTQLGLAMEYRALGPDLVRLALAVGDSQRARRVPDAVAKVAAMNDVPSLTGVALRCRGLAEDDADVLEEAATFYAAGTRPLEHAQACEDAGAAFARRGEVDRARPMLERALKTYRGLDATRDLARAEATLRVAGIRLGRRGARKRPLFGWESLTSTEHVVAELVSEGLTNRQIGRRMFVSPRTVQTHLAHIFGKLDLTTRSQLAAEVTRRTSHLADSRPT